LKPGVTYIGLPRRFIAGEIVLGDKNDECAAGIKVSLSDGDSEMECETDGFGDFEFEGLDQGRKYTIRVHHTGYLAREIPVVTHTDVNMGVIELEPET